MSPSAAPSAPLRPVATDEIERFARDGVVLLKQIHPTEWVDRLRDSLNEVFDRTDSDPNATWSGASTTGDRTDMADIIGRYRASRPDADVAVDGAPDEPITGRAIVETDPASWHAGLRAHHLGSGLAQICAELTESAEINYYSDQVFLKGPGSRTRTPWHQDQPYFLVDGMVAVCWVPVDPVTVSNGAMGYVRGSHLWDRVFKPSDFVTNTGTFIEKGDIDLSGLDHLPPESTFIDDVVWFDAEPGDVIIHHWATIHGSSGNVTTDRIRRAASVRFACEGSRFYQRPSSPEPFRNTIDLNNGDRLELADRFPLVIPSTNRSSLTV